MVGLRAEITNGIHTRRAVDHPRNGLLLFIVFEKFFDDSRIVIVKDKRTMEYRMLVIDSTAVQIPVSLTFSNVLGAMMTSALIFARYVVQMTRGALGSQLLDAFNTVIGRKRKSRDSLSADQRHIESDKARTQQLLRGGRVGDYHGHVLRLGPRVPFGRCLKFHARSAIASQIDRGTLRTGALTTVYTVSLEFIFRRSVCLPS